MSIADQTVLVVTGTANSGSAIVRTVADAGGTVGFTYHADDGTAQSLQADLPGEGHQHWQCDVTDADATEAVVEDAFDTLGPIDALVYTAGVIDRSSVAETEPAGWQDHLDINVTGAFHVLRAAAPRFRSQGHGSIVALSASAGILRNEELSAYDASKRGLEALAEETARELGPHGVRVNVIAPGFIRDVEAISDDHREELLDQQPYKTISNPQAIADAALFLCSERASTITGAVLPVDSGLALE